MSDITLPKDQTPEAKERGQQDRPMSEEEALEQALEDSMDGSDPVSLTQPGKHKEDKDKTD